MQLFLYKMIVDSIPGIGLPFHYKVFTTTTYSMIVLINKPRGMFGLRKTTLLLICVRSLNSDVDSDVDKTWLHHKNVSMQQENKNNSSQKKSKTGSSEINTSEINTTPIFSNIFRVLRVLIKVLEKTS